LIGKTFYGKWFIPPKSWEKVLLGGYLNNIEGLIKPSDPKIDIMTEEGLEILQQKVRKLTYTGETDSLNQTQKAKFNFTREPIHYQGKTNLTQEYGIVPVGPIPEPDTDNEI